MVSLPPLISVAATSLFLVGLGLFALRVRLRGWPDLPGADRRATSPIASRLMIHYVLFLVGPIERALAATGVSPTSITIAGLVLSAVAGAFAAFGWFGAAAAAFLTAGFLDILDGRVARRRGRSSDAGALVDSIADRWGEWFLIAGIALALPGRVALGAALICLAGSQMVSYTRARAEGLGVEVKEGLMQRGERIAILALALLVASAGGATGLFEPGPVLIWTMLFVGTIAGATSLRRLAAGVRALKAKAAGAARLEAVRSQGSRVKGQELKIRVGI